MLDFYRSVWYNGGIGCVFFGMYLKKLKGVKKLDQNFFMTSMMYIMMLMLDMMSSMLGFNTAEMQRIEVKE